MPSQSSRKRANTATPSRSRAAGSKKSSSSPGPSISYIIPTISRPGLLTLIDDLRVQAGPHDEIIVVGDGKQLLAQGLLNDADPRIRYFEVSGGFKGNPQRDFAMKHATCDFLMFLDDDDALLPGAIPNIVRPALAKNPSRPHLFRVPGILPDKLAGSAFVPPNNPKKLTHWDRRELDEYKHFQLCDRVFIAETLKFYNKPPIRVNRCIITVRPGTPFLVQELFGLGFGLPELNGYADLDIPGRYDRLNELLDQFQQEAQSARNAEFARAEAREHLLSHVSRSLRGE